MQPNSSPGEQNGLGLGPHSFLSAANGHQPPWLYPSARLGLIFSSGRFILNNYLIDVSLNFEGMSPLKGYQDDHWKGKISWKCHFQAKPNIILLENCPGGLHEGAETGRRRSPGVFAGRMT
jgi:hypothetical protein